MPLNNDEKIPQLTGKNNFENYICSPGEKVACNKDSGSSSSSNSSKNSCGHPKIGMSPSKQLANEACEEDCWYLGEIISYNSKTKTYTVDDYDGDSNERWVLNHDKVLPLPNFKSTNPLHNFKPDDKVLALYPQTTCFYRAVVYDSFSVVSNVGDEYMIAFEDPNYGSGWSPPMPVHKRFVISAPLD